MYTTQDSNLRLLRSDSVSTKLEIVHVHKTSTLRNSLQGFPKSLGGGTWICIHKTQVEHTNTQPHAHTSLYKFGGELRSASTQTETYWKEDCFAVLCGVYVCVCFSPVLYVCRFSGELQSCCLHPEKLTRNLINWSILNRTTLVYWSV